MSLRAGFVLLCFVLTFAAVTGFGQCEPRIDMSALLSNVEVSGNLYVGQLYGRCLPKPAKASSSSFEYNPYDGGKLSMILKSSNGQAINTFVWYGHQIQSLWELSRYEIVGGPQALKKLSPGSYSLEFAVEDKVFQRFPFSVTTRESSDQFNPQTLYLLDGGWRDYAELYAPSPDRFFQLIVWLRNDAATGDPKAKPIRVGLRLIRVSDNKTIGEGDADSYNLTHKWTSVKLSFRKPKAEQGKDYSEFKLSEILAVDSSYRIELTQDGRARSDYTFTVKNGQINGIDLAQMRKEIYRILIPLTNERSGK